MLLLRGTSCAVWSGRVSGAICAALKMRKSSKSNKLKGVKVYQTISYQTLKLQGGAESARTKCLVMPRGKTSGDGQIVPISNLPSDNAGKGMPSQRDFTIYRLKQRISTLRESERNLLGKLSRCLVLIVELERYLDTGLHHGQWDTYEELMARRAKLRAFRELICDPVAESGMSEAEAAALKEKLKL